MLWSKDQRTTLCACKPAIALALLGALWLSAGVSQAFAQTSTGPAKSSATKSSAPAGNTTPPAASTTGKSASSSGKEPAPAWVKLCFKNKQTNDKQICLTNHERMDGNTGMVLVGAAVRTVEGDDKQTLLVRLPTAIILAIPAGVRIRVDDNKPVMMQYTLCYPANCEAETPMTSDLLSQFRKGKQLIIEAVNLQRKVIALPVTLQGFGQAFDGPPVDLAKYQEALRQTEQRIRQRQIELANKAAQAAKNKAAKSGKAGSSGAAADEAQAAPPGPPIAQPAPAFAVPAH